MNTTQLIRYIETHNYDGLMSLGKDIKYRRTKHE